MKKKRQAGNIVENYVLVWEQKRLVSRLAYVDLPRYVVYSGHAHPAPFHWTPLF